MTNLKKRLLAIYELAQRGIGGEKTNAEYILNKTLKENNITLEEFLRDKEEKKLYLYRVKNRQEANVVNQVVAKIINAFDKVPCYRYKNSKFLRFYKLSQSEHVAVSMLADLYIRAFRAEKKKLQQKHRLESKLLFISFCHKHNIFPENNNPQKSNRKIISLSIINEQIRNMDDVRVNPELPGKLLEGGKKCQ